MSFKPSERKWIINCFISFYSSFNEERIYTTCLMLGLLLSPNVGNEFSHMKLCDLPLSFDQGSLVLDSPLLFSLLWKESHWLEITDK